MNRLPKNISPTYSQYTMNHIEEIAEFNRIMGDEIKISRQYAQSIHLMNCCKKACADVIEQFNFELVTKFMRQVGWKWASDRGMKYPEKDDFIRMFNEFTEDAIFDFVNTDQLSYIASSGGITFMMFRESAGYVDEDDVSCNILFNIAGFTGDDY